MAAAARAAGIEAGVAAGGAPEVEKAQIGKGWNRIKGEFVAVYV